MAAITNRERQWRKWLLSRNLKYCPCCGQIRDISIFAENKQTADSLQSYCRRCYAAIYCADRDRRLEWQKKYASEHVDDVKCSQQEYYQVHREELLSYQAQRYQENREAILEYNKQYAQTEKGQLARQVNMRRRRAREAQSVSDLTMEQWIGALQYFNGHCAYCGRKADKLHIEHFIPTAHGGGLTVDNIVPACPACNMNKKDTYPYNWAKGRGAKYVQSGAIESIEVYFASLCDRE